MSTLVGVRAALESEAHHLRPEGLPLRSTLRNPRSKTFCTTCTNQVGFPQFKATQHQGMSVPERQAMSLWLYPQSPFCSGRLKKNSGDQPNTRNKLKVFASVPALLQAHPLMSRRCQSLLRNPIQNVLNDLNYLNELNSAGGRRSFRIIARRDARGFFSHNR